MLTIAIPKGRLADETLKLFKTAGILDFTIPPESRELLFDIPEKNIRFLLIRAQDVGTYVERGIADMGIAGKDILEEYSFHVYQILDLGFGYCRLALAVPEKSENILQKPWIRIASKYFHIAEDFFHGQGINANIIKLYGSVEIAAITNLCDGIVDLVSTGETLKANGLKEVVTIMESTARLVVSKSALPLKSDQVKSILKRLESVLE